MNDEQDKPRFCALPSNDGLYLSTWADILSDIQRCRDETAAREDMVGSDGTIFYSKEQGLETVRQYDQLIDWLTRQVETAEAAPLCP